MSNSHFPNFLDLERLNTEFAPSDTASTPDINSKRELQTPFSANDEEKPPKDAPQQGLTGTRLRSYAFAVLTRREYSKTELIEKLMLRAAQRDEVIALVDEFAQANYQSDARVTEMTIRSYVRKGKGPYRIQESLKNKNISLEKNQSDLEEIDWKEQCYQLKVKKFGVEIAQDIKLKAKQVRFLQYRGFAMDCIMFAIRHRPE